MRYLFPPSTVAGGSGSIEPVEPDGSKFPLCGYDNDRNMRVQYLPRSLHSV